MNFAELGCNPKPRKRYVPLHFSLDGKFCLKCKATIKSPGASVLFWTNVEIQWKQATKNCAIVSEYAWIAKPALPNRIKERREHYKYMTRITNISRGMWTEERVNELKYYLNAGCSDSQTATRMNFSKGKIIGKRHRLGMSCKGGRVDYQHIPPYKPNLNPPERP